ncbi:unnamed protein product [marine sediment metagenome]|uniref:Uncharacterized protein n=1 Tax=marine sediment metagenome TaxID=412755 RepID=X0UJ44_9ZZZZ
MDYKITAFDLKLALLQYCRFERQWVCVEEFRGADVFVDTDKDIIEIEVKVNKGDLENKEIHKVLKHQRYRVGRSHRLCHPNRFYFCVPEFLVKSAHQVCESLNPKYGIIAFNPDVFERHIKWGWRGPHKRCLRMARGANRLHENYSSSRKDIAMRASAKTISLMEQIFRRNYQDIERIKND